MDYKQSAPHIQPRLIIHGGAGNISRATITPEMRVAYRAALTEIVARTSVLLALNKPALEIATHAVSLLEDNPLFNSGYGAVFTRDGINELEASVMVSRGRAKRGVGVMGLTRVRNPVLLARRMLQEGDSDLAPRSDATPTTASDDGINIDRGAQGHTQIHGATAEALAARYGLPLVEPSYFFTQKRWDEHVRGLEREAAANSGAAAAHHTSASWSADEYLPQGTVGAVALDSDGVVCCATSTGGLTNKLTGRIGDTPVVGAGSWAQAWTEDGDPTSLVSGPAASAERPVVELSRALCRLLADCLPIPASFVYSPVPTTMSSASTETTRSVAVSGTGNGDSFLRVAAGHAVAAMAQYKPVSSTAALSAVTGRGGLLQQSAEDRFGLTGEGEGGMIGIESVVVRDKASGAVKEVRNTIMADCNCGGMFRGWIDDDGRVQVRIFRDDTE